MHGNQLREERRKRGLSLEALAHRVPCSASMLRFIERGLQPSDELAERIKQAIAQYDAEQATVEQAQPA